MSSYPDTRQIFRFKHSPHNVIICGLPKTGTTSVTKALQMLWYDASECSDPFNDERLDYLSTGDYDPDPKNELNKVLGDIHYSAYWHSFKDDARYKFILTTRDIPAWLDSFIATQGNRPPARPHYKPSTDFRAEELLMRILTGDKLFLNSRADLEHLYYGHKQEVEFYVPNNRLLIYNVNEGWEPLLDFLEIKPALPPFPHENKR